MRSQSGVEVVSRMCRITSETVFRTARGPITTPRAQPEPALRPLLLPSPGPAECLATSLLAASTRRKLIRPPTPPVGGVLRFVIGLCLPQHCSDLGGKLLLLAQHPAVAHGFVRTCVCLHLCAIQRHPAQLDIAGLLAEAQNLQEEAHQGHKMDPPKLGDHRVVWMAPPVRSRTATFLWVARSSRRDDRTSVQFPHVSRPVIIRGFHAHPPRGSFA
jgi:hypothetical protein